MSQFGHSNIVRAEFQRQLKYIILKRICIYVCGQTDLLQLLLLVMCMYAGGRGAYTGQCWNFLELELQLTVSCLMWHWELNLHLQEEQYVLFTTEPALQPPTIIFENSLM